MTQEGNVPLVRGVTPPDLAGRCPRCWLQTPRCLCGRIPKVLTAIDIVIVRHPVELWRPSGTARIAELALERCRILGLEQGLNKTNLGLATLSGAWLLYPGGTMRPKQAQAMPRPKHLVVLDGTWRQVRRMVRRLPALWEMPRLSLPDKPDPPLRLRRGQSAEQRSTLESIADAIALLEGDGSARALHQVHELFVEQSFLARGRKPHYCPP